MQIDLPVRPRRLALACLAALGLGLVAPAPARAELRVCNDTSNRVDISLGFRAAKGWQSEGWWPVEPNGCTTIVQGDLTAQQSQFFYLFGIDVLGSGVWQGQIFMCTRDESFTIFGVENCLARGHERTGFFEVDTQKKSDWTVRLTDGAAEGGEGLEGTDAE